MLGLGLGQQLFWSNHYCSVQLKYDFYCAWTCDAQIFNMQYQVYTKNNDRGGLVFIPVMWSKHNYLLLKVQCFEAFSQIFHNGSAYCMAFVWGITLQKLCMILVLPVKDTVGREPLLKVLTFPNQEQETTIICRQRKFHNQYWPCVPS